jgi:hypothetical protein
LIIYQRRFILIKQKQRLSIPTYGFNDLIYDSQHEAEVSIALKDSVRYLGGNSYSKNIAINGYLVVRPANKHHRKISCIDKKGIVIKTIPDFELVERADVFIEAKGNLDERSRRNIDGLLRLGYSIGVVFISERAANTPIWRGAQVTKAQWLSSHCVPFVTEAAKAPLLIPQLLALSEVL